MVVPAIGVTSASSAKGASFGKAMNKLEVDSRSNLSRNNFATVDTQGPLSAQQQPTEHDDESVRAISEANVKNKSRNANN